MRQMAGSIVGWWELSVAFVFVAVAVAFVAMNEGAVVAVVVD